MPSKLPHETCAPSPLAMSLARQAHQVIDNCRTGECWRLHCGLRCLPERQSHAAWHLTPQQALTRSEHRRVHLSGALKQPASPRSLKSYRVVWIKPGLTIGAARSPPLVLFEARFAQIPTATGEPAILARCGAIRAAHWQGAFRLVCIASDPRAHKIS